MKLNLAPSYKAVAIAILKNDYNLTGLGLKNLKSEWYDFFKRKELLERGEDVQGKLF